MRRPWLKITGGIVVIATVVAAGIYAHYDQEKLGLADSVRHAVGGSYVRLPDGVTHYELLGSEAAQTVILVHGFSVPYYIWDPTFDALAKAGFRVVRYDLYGRGYSDRPDVVYDANLFDRQLLDLLNALNIRTQVDLAGLSMGGPIVATFAARHPEKVRSVSFFDPAFSAGNPLPFYVRAPFIGEYFMDVFMAPSLAESQLGDFYHPENYPDWPSRYRVQMQYKGFRRALLSTRRNYMTRDNRADFERIGRNGLPVLVVWGRADKDVPFEISQSLLRAIPQAQFHPIDQAGHIPHYERPEVVNPILIQFLNQNHK